ncbi:hypothetical protein [Delftia acidovorans]|uniref:hypothetical protein n=1 Tax=Delftia acidovorans TaxID=80866 RepID=UPI0012EEAD12|nr:hypothetical protein [Delftia acidovorans]QPS74001.1 hypothetical protein I6G48_25720 [Delftia acidovorans]QPS74863.1 hypothetical protein I6G48_30385 [Delftia acidovorans]
MTKKEATPMTEPPMQIDFGSASPEQVRALQKLADRAGLSFEDFALKHLLLLAERDEKKPAQGPIGRLLGFRRAH